MARQRVGGKWLYLLAGLVYLARWAGSDRGGDVVVHARPPDGLSSTELGTLHALMRAVKNNKCHGVSWRVKCQGITMRVPFRTRPLPADKSCRTVQYGRSAGRGRETCNGKPVRTACSNSWYSAPAAAVYYRLVSSESTGEVTLQSAAGVVGGNDSARSAKTAVTMRQTCNSTSRSATCSADSTGAHDNASGITWVLPGRGGEGRR